MKDISKLLKFLQLTDRQGDLSITNIATIVVITKIALAVSLDWGVISGLLITLLNYGHKRHEANKSVKDAAETPSPIDIEPIHESLKELRQELTKVKNVAAEAKDKASKMALSMGITTKKLGS